MIPDRYTKVVLTIIATALVWLCVRDMVPTIHAQATATSFERLRVTNDERNPVHVKIVGIERTRWTVTTGPLDRHKQEHSLAWEPIDVITR